MLFLAFIIGYIGKLTGNEGRERDERYARKVPDRSQRTFYLLVNIEAETVHMILTDLSV